MSALVSGRAVCCARARGTRRSRWRGCAGGCARAPTPPRWRPASSARSQQLGSARDLRSGRRKRLFRLALEPGGEPDHLLKRCGYPPARGWLRHARRLEGAARARDRGGARASAACRWSCPWRRASGAAPGGSSSASCWRRCSRTRGICAISGAIRALAAGERRRLAASLGELVRRAHAAGLHQDDLAPNNVLVSGGASRELRLVDFERARLRRSAGNARPASHAREARARGRRRARCAAPALPARLRGRRAPRRAAGGSGCATRRRGSRGGMTLGCVASPRATDAASSASSAASGAATRGAASDPGAGLARAGARPRAERRRRPRRGRGRDLARGLPAAVRASQRAGCGRARTRSRRAGSAPVPLAMLSDRERTLLIVEPGRRRASARLDRVRRSANAARRRGCSPSSPGSASCATELGPDAFTLVWSPSRPPARPARRAARFRFAGRAGGAPQPGRRRPSARLPRASRRSGRLVRSARLPIGGGMGDINGARPLFSSFADDPALGVHHRRLRAGARRADRRGPGRLQPPRLQGAREPRERAGQRRGGRRLRAARELRFGDRGDMPRPAAGADLSRARRAHRDRALRSPRDTAAPPEPALPFGAALSQEEPEVQRASRPQSGNRPFASSTNRKIERFDTACTSTSGSSWRRR